MKRLFFALLFASVAFAQSGGQPVSILITNPVLLGSGQPFTQDLGVSPATLQALPNNCCMDGIYTLQFTIQNYFAPASYPGALEIEIYFGTQRLCEGYWWGISAFKPITMICPSPAYIVFAQALPSGGPVQGQQHLFITWTVNPDSFNPDWPLKFYNVSLTFTPEN